MGSSRLVAVAVGLVLGLAGCATTTAPTYHAQLKPIENQLDHEKMNSIDARARMRGVRVVWVNLPVKRVDENIESGE